MARNARRTAVMQAGELRVADPGLCSWPALYMLFLASRILRNGSYAASVAGRNWT